VTELRDSAVWRYVRANGGRFVWADFGRLLASDPESALFDRFLAAKAAGAGWERSSGGGF